MDIVEWTNHMNTRIGIVVIDGKNYIVSDTGETDQQIIDKIKAMSIEEPIAMNPEPTVQEAIDIIIKADLSSFDKSKLETLNTKVNSVLTTGKEII